MTHQADKWQDEWPGEEGWWWFFGYRFGKDERFEKKPELCLVEVRKVRSAVAGEEWDFMHITRGHTLYKEEGAVGKWLKADLPELPKL